MLSRSSTYLISDTLPPSLGPRSIIIYFWVKTPTQCDLKYFYFLCTLKSIRNIPKQACAITSSKQDTQVQALAKDSDLCNQAWKPGLYVTQLCFHSGRAQKGENIACWLIVPSSHSLVLFLALRKQEISGGQESALATEKELKRLVGIYETQQQLARRILDTGHLLCIGSLTSCSHTH